jgi:hypothetical protein
MHHGGLARDRDWPPAIRMQGGPTQFGELYEQAAYVQACCWFATGVVSWVSWAAVNSEALEELVSPADEDGNAAAICCVNRATSWFNALAPGSCIICGCNAPPCPAVTGGS